MKEIFETKKGDISGCLDFIHKTVDDRKLDKKEKVKALLMAEEALVLLDNATKEDGKIRISIYRRRGDTVITMSSKGEEFDLFGGEFFEDTTSAKLDVEGMSGSTEEEIRRLLLSSFQNKIKQTRKSGENRINIVISRSRYKMLRRTMCGLFLGIFCGVLFKVFLSDATCGWINQYVLGSVTDLFMKSLKIVIAPVVFLSIATSVSGFGNMSELGKIGAKTMGFYLMTSVVAISLGTGLFFLFQTGNSELVSQMGDVAQIADTAKETSTSLLDTVLNIVPDNIVKPFFDSDMLQIIFLAVLIGIATSIIGKKAESFSNLLDSLNEVFMKVTMMIMTFIPVATFCSMCSMVLMTGFKSLLSVLAIVGLFILGILMMNGIYMIMLFAFTRVNPFIVMRKYFPTMVQVFSICSSNASIPMNMKACGEELGIHPRVYSLTIPLGATINMDGTCVAISVVALSCCRIFGVALSPGALFTVLFTIMLLSVGSPGVPNSGIVLLALILDQVGVPVAAVSLFMGVWPIIDMFSTANNCLGDVVGTFSVANSEGMVDKEVLKGKVNQI